MPNGRALFLKRDKTISKNKDEGLVEPGTSETLEARYVFNVFGSYDEPQAFTVTVAANSKEHAAELVKQALTGRSNVQIVDIYDHSQIMDQLRSQPPMLNDLIDHEGAEDIEAIEVPTKKMN